ncbi:MAG: hypothetical protein AAFO94_10985, partial [Bacteroidota bacterium]
GARAASVNDATAGFWNPAALTQLQIDNGLQVGFMHSEWFAGVGKYDYLSVAGRVGESERRMGLSLIRFGIDDIPNTLNLYDADGRVNYDNVTNFSAADYALLLSYAQPLAFKKLPLSVGGNLKIIYRGIGSFATAWGFGLDAGLHYRGKHWQFGVVGKDITTTFNAWRFTLTDADKEVLQVNDNELPENELEITNPRLVFGVSYETQYDKIGWKAETNFTLSTDGQRNTLLSADPFSIDPVLGVEANYQRFVFLRLGINNVQEERDLGVDPFWTLQPNMGVGLRIKNLQLDYAYTDVGGQSEGSYSHVISVLFDVRFKKR